AKGSLTRDAFRNGNDRLRDAAHELAAMRESDAMAGALVKLIEDTEGMSDTCAEAARGWSERLGPSQSLAYTGSAERAAAIIDGFKEDARLWALGYGAWEIIEPGIRRTYRNGRKGLERAEADPSDETLHEWRKRVKDMWYSLRLLQKMWPPVLEVVAEEAHRVSELLGDHHDLGELATEIENNNAALTSAVSAELMRHARAKQARLYDAAIVKGRRLYAERPRRYSERLGALWQSWESER
ncbi:MAG TPA: CHAD domain-containing protein, partial [Solirubrobacterales bacterium]|nr:CHAD domain-containing protein [Solirubrobacterales bacterium]